jgi:hypothetical protein
MALSNGKIAGLLGAVLLIALLAFAAGFLLGLSSAAGLRGSAASGAPANAVAPDAAAAGSGGVAGADGRDGSDAAAPASAPNGGDGPDAAAPDGSGDEGAPAAEGEGASGGGQADGGQADGGPGEDGGGGQAPGYSVLAGEHAVEARAAAAAKRLTDGGFAAEVVALEAANGPWFQVVVGGFGSLQLAREAAMQIRTEIGVDGLVGLPPAQAANADPGG